MAALVEKQEVLTGCVEEAGDALAKDCSGLRSKVLQHAVSQCVRQAQLHQQQAAEPQQPSIVRWERFLPQEQLRVLLVEDDDSTGHVVTALLRNCGYEVTSAANGLLAWELLMDQSNHVDLVLTEVVMPGLSGISLLTRIMTHEPLKNIPVIMMSSHDSMGLVFKCLSKGAVDFLVKPVRKNELKNLWQHIWRRCHSSSGSGTGSASGSGSPVQKVPEHRAAAEADNGGSSDESDSMSSELNLDGGSDNGSGTQSLWTKRTVKVECSREGILGSSTPHFTIQSKDGCLFGADYQKNNDVSLDRTKSDSGFAVKEWPFLDNDQMKLMNSKLDVIRTGLNARDMELCEGSGLPCVNQQTMEMVKEIPPRGQESADEQQEDNEDAENLLEKHASNSPSSKEKTLSDSSSPSLLKLSLKRPSQAASDAECEVQGGLKRSCSSAFSRYKNTVTTNNSTKNNPPSLQYASFGLPPSKPLSSIGTDEAIASPFFGGISRCSGNQNSSDVQKLLPGQHGVTSCFAQEGAQASACPGFQMHFGPSPGMPVDPNLTSEWGPSVENMHAQEFLQGIKTNHDAQVHHHHHHHHHHVQHHYHHHQEQRPQTPEREDLTVLNVGSSAPRCASSNMEKALEGMDMQSGSCNGHVSNGNGAVSLNGSATGSNYASNGDQSGAAEPGNLDSSSQIGVGGGGAMGAAQGFLVGSDESRHARREAALTKFRRKRKERCFEKKVRYQSRKRLAEQRPRVRGQFVRRSL